jgi:hypothetical protein
MKKDYVISKIEASQDGSPYVYVSLAESGTSNSQTAGRGSGKTLPHSPFGVGVGAFTSPEDLMKNLPKAMSNMLGSGETASGDSPTIKMSMREYEDMQLRVGDKVNLEIKKADSSGI